ncbi:hypothetical protein [Paenibacillus thermotolerans]|uniref:hypothetical protein n=1 Tax=Paenibacillus thermotolerans TaxID=3027807 RepID=UPI00236884A0|nr:MULTISPECIES: hypothetical protein [unclassified Paenibacillus]
MKKLWMFLLAAALVGALTACGGGSKDASGDAAQDVSDVDIDAQATGATVNLPIDAKNFQFDQEEYRVKAGETVNLTFTSSEGMHGLQIKGIDVDLQDGQGTTFVAEEGEYEIVCSVMCGVGHGDMVAKLIVE